ncbi:hypothetical protein G6F68_016556 [Rhizopus microsporus]|nr:hypothetical protein G6F68_016556 [Rhizopus microsporus]
MEAVQGEDLGVDQQQAQPQALQQYGADAQRTRTARPQAQQQRQQAGQRAEREQVAGQGDGQIGQAGAAARIVTQRYIAQRARGGQYRIAGDEQRPPRQPAPTPGGTFNGGGVGPT